MTLSDIIKQLPGSVQIKQSTVQILKRRDQREDMRDEEFIEWWQRKHGLKYPIEIIREVKE